MPKVKQQAKAGGNSNSFPFITRHGFKGALGGPRHAQPYFRSLYLQGLGAATTFLRCGPHTGCLSPARGWWVPSWLTALGREFKLQQHKPWCCWLKGADSQARMNRATITLRQTWEGDVMSTDCCSPGSGGLKEGAYPSLPQGKLQTFNRRCLTHTHRISHQ